MHPVTTARGGHGNPGVRHAAGKTDSAGAVRLTVACDRVCRLAIPSQGQTKT